jgi:hypothetical protein
MNPAAGFGLLLMRRREHEEVSTVAATIDIEVESGVYADPIRRHRGYYAGDFSQRPVQGESLPQA